MSTLAVSLGRRRGSMWGMLTLAAALATGLSIYSYLSWLRAQVPVAGRLVPMVVASHNLEAGTTISSSDLTISQHPERYLPPQALGSLALAIGKVATVPIYKGEALTAPKLAREGGASGVVPKGMRAYTLSFGSSAGPSFMPHPGDRVDVIATFPREVLGEATSATILRSKLVASTPQMGTGASGKVASRLGLEGSQIGVTIVLFVTPSEAERLAMAESLGKITIVLAPPADEGGPGPQPVRPQDLSAR